MRYSSIAEFLKLAANNVHLEGYKVWSSWILNLTLYSGQKCREYLHLLTVNNWTEVLYYYPYQEGIVILLQSNLLQMLLPCIR